MRGRESRCDRSRRLVSLELDGALSEFERFAVRRHLGRCAACQSFASDLNGLTTLLREAPLVPLPHPLRLDLPRRLRPYLLAASGSLAAAAAAAAAAVVITGFGSGAPATHITVETARGDLAAMRLMRAHQLRPVATGFNSLRRVVEVD
ncbi:MAG TPA: zf-HC2 domain-containing protein [Gaiellaceae bacterium]|nr:zf-HC2 domain-containing protein [Gaiellaceae bacterium]